MHLFFRLFTCLAGVGLVVLVACGALPMALPALPFSLPFAAPTPSRQISYDGAVQINLKAGETLPGTGIAYQGKAPDGRAIMTINNLQALKSVADSVNWTGALVLFSLVDMQLRILTYNENSMALAGTIHIVIQEPNPVTAANPPNPMASFSIPLTFTVATGDKLPGTVVSYVGDKTGSAEFANLDQYPYRERLDSVVWEGTVRDRVAVRMDLRVLDFNDARVILGGTTTVAFEPG